MLWRIEIENKEGIKDPLEISVESGLSHLLPKRKDIKVKVKHVYFIEGEIDYNKIIEIIDNLLLDKITQNYRIYKGFYREPEKNEVVVSYLPGVMDPAGEIIKRTLEKMNIKVKYLRTGRIYKFIYSEKIDLDYITRKLIYNPLIEHRIENLKLKTLSSFYQAKYEFELKTIDILNADDSRLLEISKKGQLSLNLAEMRRIKEYFAKEGRNPTDCELETIAQTWSEHCKHKTFRGIIEYIEIDENGNILKQETINDLLKQTIVRVTEESNSDLCVSVFKDNAGIVKFNENKNFCIKVETHNHPSALEPYGGAATGIGGVIRDILGAGLGGEPVCNIDVFCFGNPDIDYSELPEGVLHPRRIINGVVSGVRDYGNNMGIPTVAGAVIFDSRYIANPLVYAGTVGIIDKDKAFKKIYPGELIIVCGGRTGRDGIHGATFSSAELDKSSQEISSGSVQIGNPVEEKKLTTALMRALKKNLYTAITDCGAGGLSSAVGELTAEHGCEVYLEKVPLKYSGLTYTEIWISESQERMVIITPEDNLKKLEKIFKEEDVEFAVIGKVTDTGRLVLYYNGNIVCNLDMQFLHKGVPQIKKKAVWKILKRESQPVPEKEDYTQDLKKLLGSYNISSKEWIISQYDHEVQGGSTVKPLMGYRYAPEDGAIIKPDLNSDKFLVIGLGINPFYSEVDPYYMSMWAIDEAVRNLVSMGVSLDKIVLLDNFCWGSPDRPETLAGLVRSAKGCYHYASVLKIPFVSGKDSLYNEYFDGEKYVSIPGTLLITGAGIIENKEKIIPTSFKNKDNLVYIAGITKPETGCGEYARLFNIKNYRIPQPDPYLALNIFKTINKISKMGLIESMHDVSEGGLAVSITEMCFLNNIGVKIELDNVITNSTISPGEILFSESASRFIIEVKPENQNKFEKEVKDIPVSLIGKTTSDEIVEFLFDKKRVIYEKLSELYRIWRRRGV